jgi:hypothetical protein
MVAIGKNLVEVKGRVGHGKYERFIRERLRFGTKKAISYSLLRRSVLGGAALVPELVFCEQVSAPNFRPIGHLSRVLRY